MTVIREAEPWTVLSVAAFLVIVGVAAYLFVAALRR
jgi:hypothetical protein